jgi:putative phosphoesterase
MKLGIISDIHGNVDALTAVLHALETEQVDLILCAGDLVCYGAHPNEVLDVLRAYGVPSVVGNYDDAVAWNRPTASRTPSSPRTELLKRTALAWTTARIDPKHIAYLRGLPWALQYRLDGLSIHVLHAGPNALDDWFSPQQPDALSALAQYVRTDVVILGHTHHAYKHLCEGTLVINPGAVGRALDGDTRAAYAILDTATRHVRLERIAYDVDAAVRAIETSGMPYEIATLIRHAARRLEEVPIP